jgi:hypothetical protein
VIRALRQRDDRYEFPDKKNPSRLKAPGKLDGSSFTGGLSRRTYKAQPFSISKPPPRRARVEGKEMTDAARTVSRPWTHSDDEKLRALALSGASSRAIAHKLNRTISAVGSRAKRLNIILKKATIRRLQMG